MLSMWIRGIAFAIVVAVIGGFVILKGQLDRATAELEVARATIAGQEQVIAALEEQRDFESRVSGVLSGVEDALQASPNAAVLVPSDIASIWAGGIDGVRDDGGASRDSREP